jgi:hypothetical protein
MLLTEASAASEKAFTEIFIVDGHSFNESRTHGDWFTSQGGPEQKNV